MTGKATVKMKYRLLCMSRLSSALVRASVPAMSVRLPCVRGSVGPVIFRGDGEEGLLEAEAGDLEVRHDVVQIQSSDSDATLYAVIDAGYRPSEIEVTSLGLEQAFLAITAEDDRTNGTTHAGETN